MTLQFLTIEMMRSHLRLDDDASDQELLLYGASAEQEALKYMDRTLESLYDEYGEVPADIILACLVHVSTAYKYREEVNERKLYRLPYTWEAKLFKYKPANRI